MEPCPDITEVRPEVRFRRFCHRAPTESQLPRDTLQFGLLVSSLLSKEGAVLREGSGAQHPQQDRRRGAVTCCRCCANIPPAAWPSEGKPRSCKAGALASMGTCCPPHTTEALTVKKKEHCLYVICEQSFQDNCQKESDYCH